jgi:hypothetical protein
MLNFARFSSGVRQSHKAICTGMAHSTQGRAKRRKGQKEIQNIPIDQDINRTSTLWSKEETEN